MRLVSAIYDDFYPWEYLSNNRIHTSNPDDLVHGDVLIVWGGADIHPSLYGKGRSSYSGAGREPSTRDKIEWSLMRRNIELGNVTIGVCRGAQMLCAAAGGTLIQHVDNHSGYHEVDTHDGITMQVNSIHHQMMNPEGTEHDLLAWSKHIRSERHMDVAADGSDIDLVVQREPELIWFKDIKGLAPQWHPEMTEYKAKSNQYIREFLQGVVG